jgi:inorganic pyrophosphatase
MEDEAGLDEKIIAVPSARLTKRYDSIKSCSNLPEISIQQVKHFFEHYKDLENEKWVKVTHWGGEGWLKQNCSAEAWHEANILKLPELLCRE